MSRPAPSLLLRKAEEPKRDALSEIRAYQSLAGQGFGIQQEIDMAIKTVRFSVEVPDDVSDDDIEAWVSFELHALGNMSASNPMAHTDLQAKYGSVFVD